MDDRRVLELFGSGALLSCLGVGVHCCVRSCNQTALNYTALSLGNAMLSYRRGRMADLQLE